MTAKDKTTTDVATTTDAKDQVTGLALPSFLATQAPVTVSGTEDMPEDFTTPRIQLAQAMSPQVKKKDPEYIQDLEEGVFFHALHRKPMGESFTATILKIYDSRTLFDEDNTVDCYSSDTIHGSKHEDKCADCPLKDWIDGAPPACQTFQNHIVALDNGEAAIISIRKSNKAATTEAKNIRTQARLCERSGHGLFAYKFRFESKAAMNAKKQSYFIISAMPDGIVESEEKYLELKEMAEQFSDYNKMPVKGANNGAK